MIAPRQVIAGQTLMLTRRCAGRQFLLRPSKEVNEAFVYCFAVAAERCKLDVYWLSVMSNHHHAGIRDRLGNHPVFTRRFHSLLARCLNARLGRWENFWAAQQGSVVHLGDAGAIFDKMSYSLTNPVQDHLVEKVVNWPGFDSLRYQLSDKPVIVKRPRWFFSKNGDMPKEVTLRFVRPPEFAYLSQQEWADKIRATVAKEERKAAAQRARTGRRIVGRKAILRQSSYSCPKSVAERRGLRPRVATRNKWLRIVLLKQKRRFEQRYRAALERRQAGEIEVLFPFGSYKLVLHGLVRCEPPPALE